MINNSDFIIKQFIFMYANLLLNLGLVYLFMRFFNWLLKDAEKGVRNF